MQLPTESNRYLDFLHVWKNILICYFVRHLYFVLIGKRCELEADLCDDQCLNGGECRPVFNSYSCECTEPAYGINCENVHDVCKTENPCAYGGDCDLEGNEITCDDCDSGMLLKFFCSYSFLHFHCKPLYLTYVACWLLLHCISY